MATLKNLGHNLLSLLLLILSWGYALSFNNATGWALATIMTGLSLLSGLTMLGSYRMPNVTVRLTEMPTAKLMITLKPNHWPLRQQLRLHQLQLALIPTHRPHQWQTTTTLPRGVYDHLQLTWHYHDPLQLFGHRSTQTITTALSVPPQLQPEAAQAAFLQIASLIHADQPNQLAQNGFETQDFRPYHPGDPSNQIDWKLTAKTQTPMLRVLAQDDPVPWCWLFFATSEQALESHLATFYTFVQLVSELPAQTWLLGTESQRFASLQPEAFARYQPYTATTVPVLSQSPQRIVLFSDGSPLAQKLQQQLAQQQQLVATIDWTLIGGESNASLA